MPKHAAMIGGGGLNKCARAWVTLLGERVASYDRGSVDLPMSPGQDGGCPSRKGARHVAHVHVSRLDVSSAFRCGFHAAGRGRALWPEAAVLGCASSCGDGSALGSPAHAAV